MFSIARSGAYKNTTQLVVTLPKPSIVDRVAVMEHIEYGQRVLVYTVEAQIVAEPKRWVHFSNGTAIGQKHIDILKAPMLAKLTALRLTIADLFAPLSRQGCPPIAIDAFGVCRSG